MFSVYRGNACGMVAVSKKREMEEEKDRSANNVEIWARFPFFLRKLRGPATRIFTVDSFDNIFRRMAKITPWKRFLFSFDVCH